jgi:hypothetical protein
MNKLFYATMAVTLFLPSSCKKSGGGDAPADAKQAGIAALDSKATSFMSRYNIPGASLLLNSRADPTTNENPFVYAMQDLMLDVVKNSTYSWQDIDQF